jgi:hypothetical protein
MVVGMKVFLVVLACLAAGVGGFVAFPFVDGYSKYQECKREAPSLMAKSSLAKALIESGNGTTAVIQNATRLQDRMQECAERLGGPR